jgi:predicted secreted protein
MRMQKKPCIVVHAYNPSYLGSRGKRIWSRRPTSQGKVIKTLYQRQNTTKGLGAELKG